MHEPALHELQQHAAALRRLARDLVGAAGADDVLQDVALEVMHAPPRRPGPVLGWLRHVVRGVASKRRRADAVRRRHEAAAASERAFEASGAATIDSLRQLTEWIAALPEPYRSTLLARYVQELTPTGIAEATGAPVRTVKTRLQRGLQLLRERADRSGGDWRGAFALAFGFDVRDVAAPAAGVAGAVTMGTIGKCVLAVGALAVATLAIWPSWAGGSPAATQQTSLPADPAVAPVADATAQPAAELPATERTSVTTSAPPALPRAGADEIVVRVVDAASGAPVTAFGLREHMSPQPPQLGGKPLPLLHAGDHPDGRVVMPASEFVDRGYVVEDAAGVFLPSRWFAAGDAVERDGERTIEVRLPPPVEVRVKIVREGGGDAIVGSRVELIRPWIVPHPVMPHTAAVPSDRFHAQPNDNEMFMKFMGGRALLLGDVATDTAGVALLRVPPGEQLALRLTGARHRTAVIEPWSAPAEPGAEVVFSVAVGATVRGSVTPTPALASLRARIPDFAAKQPDVAQLFATGVRFQHEGTGEFRPPGMLGRSPVTLAEDGSFELGGLASGTWRMFFRYALNLEREAPRRLVMPEQFEVELAKLEALTDGELRVVDVDVTDWVPGTLRAQLPRDDRMGKEGSFVLRQIASVGPPIASNKTIGLHAAPGEPIDVPLPPARYLAIWYPSSPAKPTRNEQQLLAQMQQRQQAVCLGEFEVRARAVTVAELAIDAATVSIQVVEADGTTPARGRLFFRRAVWDASIDVDANGAATFDAMPRACELKVTFYRWNAQRPNGPFTDTIDLGTLRADGKPIALRLPAR